MALSCWARASLRYRIARTLLMEHLKFQRHTLYSPQLPDSPPAFLESPRGALFQLEAFRRFPLPRRNNSLIRGTNAPALGVRAWGDITMTDSESWKERRNQVERYRVMEQETTDPLAARLLHDIVLDLEAELEGSPQSVGLDAA
jgi:hypothetical protein